MDKSIFNFMIQREDGSIIDLHRDLNLWVSSFRIFSPSPDHVRERIEGKHGSILIGTTLRERKITASFMLEAIDPTDFDLFRDELFQIFNPLQKFYIIRDLQPGKRMKVSVDSEFDIDYITLEDGEFNINFVIHSTFVESVGTTLDQFVFDEELWQIGQGLIGEDLSYVHQTTEFQIYNAGTEIVDPRIFPLEITFTGESTNLTITNSTTNDVWSYIGTTATEDIIKLDGVRSLKNETSIFSDTNHKLITLKPGWNNFIIDGVNGSFEIKFDFRFYYL